MKTKSRTLAVWGTALAALAGLAGPHEAAAQATDWLVRARAVQFDMANRNDTQIPGLSVNNRTIGEVDFSYFLSPQLAVELLVTTPQSQKVLINGQQQGSFRHQPLALSFQYHLGGIGVVRPYLGLGAHYTHISRDEILGGQASLSNSSTGGLLQAGVEIPIDRRWSLNVDLKRLWLKSSVNVNGVDNGTLKLDPTLVGAGLGYRF